MLCHCDIKQYRDSDVIRAIFCTREGAGFMHIRHREAQFHVRCLLKSAVQAATWLTNVSKHICFPDVHDWRGAAQVFDSRNLYSRSTFAALFRSWYNKYYTPPLIICFYFSRFKTLNKTNIKKSCLRPWMTTLHHTQHASDGPPHYQHNARRWLPFICKSHQHLTQGTKTTTWRRREM